MFFGILLVGSVLYTGEFLKNNFFLQVYPGVYQYYVHVPVKHLVVASCTVLSVCLYNRNSFSVFLYNLHRKTCQTFEIQLPVYLDMCVICVCQYIIEWMQLVKPLDKTPSFLFRLGCWLPIMICWTSFWFHSWQLVRRRKMVRSGFVCHASSNQKMCLICIIFDFSCNFTTSL